MSGIITSSSFAKALWPGVNAWYGRTYKDYPTEYTQIFETMKSSKAYEEDVGLTSFGLASVKPEGGSINYDTERQGFTTRYTHITYGMGFIITREMVEDDQYDVAASRKAKALARSMRQTKEILGANVLNNSISTSYLGADGVALLSASHANVTGGTWSNLNAVDLSEAALEDAQVAIAAFTDDRGLLIACKPTKLIIPPALFFEAKRILGSDLRVGTANNDPNVLRTEGIIPEIAVNHYLTGTDDWFLKTDVPDGLKHFERRADSFEMDNDFDTENAKFKATARYSFGWTDPRCIYGSKD